MIEHARQMERERNWNEDAWRRVVESRAILQEALKTVIVLASENPDMLVMHVLASDSPIRRAWEMSQANRVLSDTPGVPYQGDPENNSADSQ